MCHEISRRVARDFEGFCDVVFLVDLMMGLMMGLIQKVS